MARYAALLLLLPPLLAAVACERLRYDPARATRAYPYELHTANSIGIQVFRDGRWMEIVNSTARSFPDATLWLNQRYMHVVGDIPAGATIRVSLWEFYDERGEVFSAGGLLRTEEPTPLRLVELQLAPGEPLIGLVAVRAGPDR